SIIVFKDSVTNDEMEDVIENMRAAGAHITNIYKEIYKGFAATMSNIQLSRLQELTGKDSLIDYIESDGVVTTFD
ncbi:hypothetical protein BDZ94DRAFT_1264093, partial [Collybia nuda]